MQITPIKQAAGKYRWRYAMSLWKNPTVFLATAKAILIAIGITAILIAVLSLIADGFSTDGLVFVGKLTLIMLGIFAVLLVVGYALYAAIMGGHLIVDFTMDEKSVVFAQIAEQAKKARGIGTAAAVMGALTHTRGAVSAGIAAQRTSSTVEFHRVKKAVVDKKRSVIKLRSIGWDHVYADGEDFDFAAAWIRAHVPETAVWEVKS